MFGFSKIFGKRDDSDEDFNPSVKIIADSNNKKYAVDLSKACIYNAELSHPKIGGIYKGFYIKSIEDQKGIMSISPSGNIRSIKDIFINKETITNEKEINNLRTIFTEYVTESLELTLPNVTLNVISKEEIKVEAVEETVEAEETSTTEVDETTMSAAYVKAADVALSKKSMSDLNIGVINV